jgi:hypothetical protein
MAGNPDLFEKFFSQIAQNIKKKDFIFFRSSPPKASTRRGAGKIFLPPPIPRLGPARLPVPILAP